MPTLSQEDICKFYKSIDADQEETKVSLILASTFGGCCSNLIHNHKNDDFDLTSINRDFAVKVTSVISKASLDYIKYEDALAQGKEADKKRDPQPYMMTMKAYWVTLGRVDPFIARKSKRRLERKVQLRFVVFKKNPLLKGLNSPSHSHVAFFSIRLTHLWICNQSCRHYKLLFRKFFWSQEQARLQEQSYSFSTKMKAKRHPCVCSRLARKAFRINKTPFSASRNYA